MFEYVYMYIVQQYAPLKECIVKYWFQCPWIFKKPGSLTQFQFRASQFDLVFWVNLETTARLMFLSQFVPQIFLSVDSNVTKLLTNLLTKPSVFYYFANCFL